MRGKKSFEMFKWTTFAFVLTLMFVVLASVPSMQGGLRTLWIFLAVVSLAAGVALLFFTYRKAPKRLNFFLYDPRRGRSISEQALDFDTANDRMEGFLAAFTDNPVHLWRGIPKTLAIELQAKEPLRPAVGYKMLYELSIATAEDAIDAFLSAEDRTVAYVCRAIRDGGDEDMADYLFKIKRNGDLDEEHLAAVFSKNRKFFEGHLMRYIKENMDRFAFEQSAK